MKLIGNNPAWVNNTNGGVYVVNDLVIYLGGIYKNLTEKTLNSSHMAQCYLTFRP